MPCSKSLISTNSCRPQSSPMTQGLVAFYRKGNLSPKRQSHSLRVTQQCMAEVAFEPKAWWFLFLTTKLDLFSQNESKTLPAARKIDGPTQTRRHSDDMVLEIREADRAAGGNLGSPSQRQDTRAPSCPSCPSTSPESPHSTMPSVAFTGTVKVGQV